MKNAGLSSALTMCRAGILTERSVKVGKDGVLMDEKAMWGKRLQFLMLCGPLEDAIDLIDAGRIDSARALLVRMLDRAKEQAEKYQENSRI